MIKCNGDRVREQLCELADMSRGPEGINRLAYSENFWESNKYIAKIMEEAGMTVKINAVGNVVGTYKGKKDNRIVVGSHIDSVVNGGMYDGCVGVISGIEAVRTMHENGIVPEHTIEVVAFGEEEGLVIVGLVGSTAYCGLPPTPTMTEKMGDYGISEKDFADAKCEGPIDYSLELHIEQGGVLEQRETNIGVVSAIVAEKRCLLEFGGVANHAGTTPMSLRDDALIKAAKFILRVEEVVKETDPDMVGTVGLVIVEPNAVNTVPGKVTLTLELRSLNEESIPIAYDKLMEEFKDDIVSNVLTLEEPCYRMDLAVRNAIHESCDLLGLSKIDMGSGAGHDSMILAQVTKAGMIFIPSVKGVSHNKDEYTPWEDIINGANVLLNTICILDKAQ
ncbi:MAG: M20 family metallo-hydrolase [Firmicutes bacterium]|nr:M20 family metallo-hydrolase [Bacillota bacterium]